MRTRDLYGTSSHTPGGAVPRAGAGPAPHEGLPSSTSNARPAGAPSAQAGSGGGPAGVTPGAEAPVEELSSGRAIGVSGGCDA